MRLPSALRGAHLRPRRRAQVPHAVGLEPAVPAVSSVDLGGNRLARLPAAVTPCNPACGPMYSSLRPHVIQPVTPRKARLPAFVRLPGRMPRAQPPRAICGVVRQHDAPAAARARRAQGEGARAGGQGHARPLRRRPMDPSSVRLRPAPPAPAPPPQRRPRAPRQAQPLAAAATPQRRNAATLQRCNGATPASPAPRHTRREGTRPIARSRN